jgi:hypothetical protein
VKGNNDQKNEKNQRAIASSSTQPTLKLDK